MPAIAKIQNGAGPDKAWRPDTFHRVHPGQVGSNKLWWFQAVEGISVLSENKVRRTKGEPRTLKRIIDRYKPEFMSAVHDVLGGGVFHTYSDNSDQPDDLPTRREEVMVMLAAIMATESGGKLEAKRYEKHINDWSFGPMQILTNTAAGLNRKLKFWEPYPSVPKGGSPVEWEALLSLPHYSVAMACELLRQANKRWKLKGDPMQLYACYNAGGPYASKRTPWGLRGYDRDGMGPAKGALDHFAAWYGDACAVWWG